MTSHVRSPQKYLYYLLKTLFLESITSHTQKCIHHIALHNKYHPNFCEDETNVVRTSIIKKSSYFVHAHTHANVFIDTCYCNSIKLFHFDVPLNNHLMWTEGPEINECYQFQVNKFSAISRKGAGLLKKENPIEKEKEMFRKCQTSTRKVIIIVCLTIRVLITTPTRNS
jgi:hypothetical protein